MATVDLIALAAQPTHPFESVPVIDISGLFGDANSQAEVANTIRDACIHVGFFYVKNHGVDEALIASTVDAARRFFDLPLEEKMELDYRKTPNRGGYFPPAERGCIHECFELETGINATSNITMERTNVWPSQDLAPGFQEVVLKYYKALSELSLKILPAFALALNLPPDYFDDKAQPLPAMRLLHYPPQAEVPDNRNSGAGLHTDFQVWTFILQETGIHHLPQFFTVLWQDEVPGLQIRNTLGQWIDADPLPGTFVINIADQLSRWTNDIFKSTVHRVRNTSGARRFSIPVFFGLNDDVMLEGLPSCVSASHPARYEPILAGDYVKSRRQHFFPALK